MWNFVGLIHKDSLGELGLGSGPMSIADPDLNNMEVELANIPKEAMGLVVLKDVENCDSPLEKKLTWADKVKLNVGQNALRDNPVVGAFDVVSEGGLFAKCEEFKVRKRKGKGRKFGSLLDIQNQSISNTERRRRDKALKKKNWGKDFLEETEISGKSLSDSDINNRVSTIIKEAKQVLKLGEKIGVKFIDLPLSGKSFTWFGSNGKRRHFGYRGGVVRALFSGPIVDCGCVPIDLFAVKVALETFKNAGWASRSALTFELDNRVFINWLENSLQRPWSIAKYIAEIDSLACGCANVQFKLADFRIWLWRVASLLMGYLGQFGWLCGGEFLVMHCPFSSLASSAASLHRDSLGFSAQLSNLSIFALSANAVSGTIPIEMFNLSKIRAFDVGANNIQSTLHSDLAINMPYLDFFSMGMNQISGQIPVSISNASNLNILQFNDNMLTGNMPSLEKLNKLFKLYMGTNHLGHGTEGDLNFLCTLVNNTKLGIIYISRNNFGGVFPECIRNFSSTFLHLRIEQNIISGRIPDEIGNFNNLDGSGSFGSVYKGFLEEGGPVIAVKVLNLLNRGASKSFLAECEALKNIRHRNLVKISTTISGVDYRGDDFKALVYDFMVNGSLEEWLHPSIDMNEPETMRYMNFFQRVNAAIDVAHALEYLHHDCGTPIIHCDLKPSNILLDEEMVGHLSAFGLTKILSADEFNNSANQSSSLRLRGTIGYAPPGMFTSPSKCIRIYPVFTEENVYPSLLH
ncbi:hypothetical protein GQ457_09G031240 [Hibiscus cannabinus]